MLIFYIYQISFQKDSCMLNVKADFRHSLHVHSVSPLLIYIGVPNLSLRFSCTNEGG